MSKYRLLVWEQRERKIRKLLRMSDKKLGRKAKRRMGILKWISSYNEIAYIILVSTLIIVVLLSFIMMMITLSLVFIVPMVPAELIIFLLVPFYPLSKKDDALFIYLPKPLDVLAKTLGRGKDADIRSMTYGSPLASYEELNHPECWTDEKYGRAIRAILSWADIYAEMRGSVTEDVQEAFKKSMILKQYDDASREPEKKFAMELSAEKKRRKEQLASDKSKEELKTSSSNRALSRIGRLSSMFNDDEDMPKWVKQTNEIKRLKGLNDELGKNMITLQSALSNGERTVR